MLEANSPHPTTFLPLYAKTRNNIDRAALLFMFLFNSGRYYCNFVIIADEVGSVLEKGPDLAIGARSFPGPIRCLAP